MGTHSFLSLSSQLPFLLAAALSIIWREWGSRASPQLRKSQTAKDRCRPRYESPIMALTDKLLSQAGWMELPGSLCPTPPTASSVSTPAAKGAVVLCHLREEKITSSWGWTWKTTFSLQVILRETSVKVLTVQVEAVTSDWSSPPLEVLH